MDNPIVVVDEPPVVKPNRPVLDPSLLNASGSSKKTVLPGRHKLPFRGDVPFLKEDDAEQPDMACEVRVDIFEMRNDEDRKYYSNVWQLVSLGFAIISSEEKVYDEDVKNWRIFLRWALLYTYMPEVKKNG